MKAYTSICRNGRRRRATLGPIRKRPAWSFASTFATLEGRTLLSVAVGPVAVTTPPLSATTLTLIESTSIPPAPPELGQGTYVPTHNNHPGSSGSGGGGGTGHASQAIPTNPPDDPVSIAVAKVTVDDQEKSEFALANFDTNEVFVRLGYNGSPVELGPAQGVDHPDSVTLADLNGDGIPDLIVANTNGNNILVFPGLGDGQFGPEENGGQGFAVGSDPVSLTVNYVGGDVDKAQLIVANAESDSVTILDGQATGDGWSVTSTSTIATPSLPDKTLLYDVDNDGNPDLLVCNTGSNDVTMYTGLGNGSYDPTATATFDVGIGPEAMFVGQFDRRPDTDLITINSGSNDLTFIGNVFGPQPTTQTISSGGYSPDAAFAIDPGHTGEFDLVVANGGDGHMAVFRGGNEGLQLAGVITQASVPTPTAVAPGSWDGNSLDFFAASAGDDAALLLQFDLGVASTFLPGSSSESAAIGQADSELFAQLMPFDKSSLDLIAVLWAGNPDSDFVSGASSFREPSTVTALYSPTEGQGDKEPDRLPEGSSGPSTPPATATDPSKVESSEWARIVSGVTEALDRPHRFVEALAARDVVEEGIDQQVDGLARLVPSGREIDRLFDTEIEDAPGHLDGGTIRLFWPEGKSPEESAPADSDPIGDPFPGFDGVDAPALQGRFETVPLISTALLVSTRLIIKASPPRPPTFRGKFWPRRFVSLEHDRQDGKRPDLV